MKIFKYDVRFKTLFKRGVKSYKDDFFVGLITGYQGSGKNVLANMLIDEVDKKIVYTNVHSLCLPNKEFIYFTKLDDIYKYDDDKSIFLIDELGKKFPKESKQDARFYGWLQQSRKHNRHVYMIHQEYIQVPTWLRGVANKVYTTRKLVGSIFCSSLGIPVLNSESKEWETDNFLYIIYKRTKKYTNCYDTFERINEL